MDDRRPGAERDLFASSGPASTGETSDGRITIGISTWLVAAIALVAGIIIGFASGFTAGQRATTIVSGASDGGPDEPRATSLSAAPEGATNREFTEGAVTEPEGRQGVPGDRVRVDPEPIVAGAEEPPVVPKPQAADRATRARRPPSVEPAASGLGSLQILSRPSGAQVTVDGRVVGRTPLVMPDIRSGAHDVRLELAGFRRWATSVDVTPGNRTRVAASLEQ